MNQISTYYQSSIGKKQIVAVTGLLLNLFVIAHLAGNLFFYGGPEMFNAYSKKLTSLRPGLYVIEFGLLFIFLVHILTTLTLVLENLAARGKGYSVSRSVGQRSWATRFMSLSGTIIFAFVVWHLLDFTFVDHNGPRSILADGKSYGLYGIVYNSFKDPIHSVLYIIAMIAVGTHLSHGIESIFQTFGYNNATYTPVIAQTGRILAFIITVAFSSIPIFVLLKTYQLLP
jgi:succinate dehydrogenase / fumarate reductase cytochrome b subunit